MSKAEVICLKEYYFLIFDDRFSNTSHIIKNKRVHFWIMQSYKKNFSSSNDLIFFNILNTLFQYVFWLHYIFPRLHFQLWHCICMPHNEDTFFGYPLFSYLLWFIWHSFGPITREACVQYCWPAFWHVLKAISLTLAYAMEACNQELWCKG